MIEVARGLSFVVYTYEGGPLRFTAPFPYLKGEHVRVLVGDESPPRIVLGTWINSTTIEIPDQGPALATPYRVILRRVTPIDRLVIVHQGGAMLPDEHLNSSLRQLLYAHQESREFPADASGSTGGPPGDSSLIDVGTLVNLVTQSPAFLALQERIPEVDANAELIMDELLRSNEYFDLHRDHGDKISTAYTRIGLTETATQVLAEQYTELFARVISGETDVAAQFLEVNQAVATETSARVQAITDLHAQITTETGVAVAQAVDAVTVTVDAVESRVESVEGVVATHGTQIAAANTELTAVSDATGANTSWRQLFAASFGVDPNTGGALTAAAVKTQIDTKVTASEATSIANTSVTAFANGTFSALQNSYTAYVSANDNRWSSTWSLRINGGDPANPIVAGVSLGADPTGSTFVVQADRFAVVSPTDYGTKKVPFVVGTVGGISTVGITGALLVDGSVTATKITANSLSAITANAGTINGGTFKTHTLDASGNVVDASEFRVEVSNSGTWPLWVGSGTKTANNAVFWLDRLGNAEFKGKVSAPNIVGQFQSAVAVSWTGSVTMSSRVYGPDTPPAAFAVVHQFTLPPPIAVGESHTPVIDLTVYHQAASGVELLLEELQTSVWVEISRVVPPTLLGSADRGSPYDFAYILGSLRTSNTQIKGVGSQTTAAREFRISARYEGALSRATDGTTVYAGAGSGNPGIPATKQVTAVTGFAFGIR